MPPTSIQHQRFELKYRVTEESAVGARNFIKAYLKPDEYAAQSPGHCYAVHSVYLDSDDYWLYRATIVGTKNRFKLRLRYYDDSTNSPVYFEIKRRRDNCIFKQRVAVRRDAVDRLLDGSRPELEDLYHPDSRQLNHLVDFSRLMRQVGAKPRSIVSYMREAWMNRVDNSARITFDRSVHCAPQLNRSLTLDHDNPVNVFDREVILEIKFTDRMPAWAREVISLFHLVQCSAAKYAQGLDALAERNRSPGDSPLIGFPKPPGRPITATPRPAD